MAGNFILEEVISELVNPNASLIGPLLKLQYFAGRTKNEELMKFVLDELNGYSDNALPDYRTPLATIKVDLQFGIERRNGNDLPLRMLDSQYHDRLRHLEMRESVSVLENMAKIEYEDGKNDYLAMEFPMELLPIFQSAASKLYHHTHYKTQVVKGRLSTTRNAIPSALTAIRSRLLAFSMKIVDAFGETIEIESFNRLQKSNNDQIINIMNTTINTHGDGNVVNTGENAKIHASINVSKGNTQELNKKVRRPRNRRHRYW